MPTPLKLPDVRQQHNFDCGAAALLCLARYHQLAGPVVDAVVGRTGTPEGGTSPDVMEAMARALGLSVISGRMATADLAHFTATHRPVLCPVALTDGGHWVVVSGVWRGSVWFHDPAEGKAHIAIPAFRQAWWDTNSKGIGYTQWGIVPYVS